MHKKIKCLRLHNVGDLRLHLELPPNPNRDETLIQVDAVGLCGSDVNWYMEGGIGDANLVKPLILGHESAGQIVAGTRQGERVAIDPAIPCGFCRFCYQGNPNLCPSIMFAGHGEQDGALRERMTWPKDRLFPIPDTMSMIEGAMLEPLGVALHAIDLAKIQAGMRVGVLGCGPIGLLIIQLLRLVGASQIVATEKLSHRIDTAINFGATQVIQARDGLEVDEILSATRGEGLDVCIEVAGENEAVETAIASVSPGARVILVGIAADDRIRFQASATRRKGLTIKLSRRMKHTYPHAIQLVESGQIDVVNIVTHRFTLDEYEQAFATAARRDGLKVIIEPSR